MPSFTVPFHNYLGPGNSINNGVPVNNADSVAREHDLAYDKAKTFEQIHGADKIAISKFWDNIKKGPITSAPSNIIGLTGIGAKYAFESYLNGSVYPRYNA